MPGAAAVAQASVRFVHEAGLAADVASLAEPVLEGLGYRLVLVRIMGGQNMIVEILAERPDGSMSVEDCRTVSHNLSAVLDVHDPMPSSYRLQISSPGIDRPLVRPSDFEDWSGYEAKIELKEMVGGRKRFKGTLEGFADGEVRIEADLGNHGELKGRHMVGFPVTMIEEAKLVLTDELIRESLNRAKKQREAGAAAVVEETTTTEAGGEPPARELTAEERKREKRRIKRRRN